MTENNNGSVFITFEGGEGSGKSTQLQLLKEWLNPLLDKPAVFTREPGGTEGAEAIRDLLVTGAVDRWDKLTETLMYMAARRDHLQRVIWPSLEEGRWVVSDRFVDSTICYQGYGHNINLETLWSMYNVIAGDFMPDLTFYLDVDSEIGLKRTSERSGKEAEENRFESIDISFHKRLRAGFLTLAEQNPDRYVVIDAHRSIQAIQQTIQSTIEDRFQLEKAA